MEKLVALSTNWSHVLIISGRHLPPHTHTHNTHRAPHEASNMAPPWKVSAATVALPLPPGRMVRVAQHEIWCFFSGV